MRTDKPAYPDFLKKVENWIAQITDDRLKSYAVYECPDDKIVESMSALAKRYNFYASVEGYTYTMELLTAIKDFLKK